MMKFSELIYKRLATSEELGGMLSQFCGLPSIFTPDVPEHNQEGWSKNHYPLMVYNYDLQANAERNSAGTLAISMLCQNTEEAPVEALERTIREKMRDVVIKPSDEETAYSFAWARTDGFTVNENENRDEGHLGLTIGNEIRFDILEYPSMITTDPDPIMAIDRYIKGLFPGVLVIGYDRMEEIEEATAGRPVIYCRLTSSTNTETSNMVAWMDCVIGVHVICPNNEVRTKVAAAIAQKLSVDGEVNMFDDSPMHVRRLQANYRSDYLKEGQVFITGHYGVLRYRAKGHTLRHVYITD